MSEDTVQVELSPSDIQLIKWSVDVALDAVTVQSQQGSDTEIVGSDATRLMMGLYALRNRLDNRLRLYMESVTKRGEYDES